MSDYNIVTKEVPTFYFIGVTTGKSSIMKVFPLWMEVLGRPEVVIEGIDHPKHDAPGAYRASVAQIKYDPLSLGALVTTHKMDVYDAAIVNIEHARGQIYNIGGGPDKTISVWREFGPLLERLMGQEIPVGGGDWRPGDQRIYVSDIRKAEQELNWTPKIGVEEGVTRLFEWVNANRSLFGE